MFLRFSERLMPAKKIFKREPLRQTCEELREGDNFVKFLNPNVRDWIQPSNQEMIKNTKSRYRIKLNLSLSKQQEADQHANFMKLLKKLTITTVNSPKIWKGL